jgi:hypothetical protein
MAYDVIGDVHGLAGKLKALLRKLGYVESGTWKPPVGRQAVFLGDLIDRGPEQVEVVRIVRGMIDAGDAHCVMGNHEFNAIGFATPHRNGSGEFLRKHSTKNRRQHGEFLKQVIEGSTLHRDLIDWFRTLPPALDLGGIRVVHAWWNQDFVDLVGQRFWDGQRMSDAFLHASYERGSDEWAAMEGLTKGLEIALPAGHSFTDHDGFERTDVRTRWWLQGDLTYRDLAIVEGDAIRQMPEIPVPRALLGAPSPGAPVFVGHYWLKGVPKLQSPTVACLDYSAAHAGPMVAYRWNGESELDPGNFVVAG